MIGLLLATVGTALAAPPTDGEAELTRQRMERLERAMDAASATEDQRSRVKELLSEGLPHLAAMREEAHALRDELRAAFVAERIDRELIGQLRLEMVDLFDRATETGFELWADVAEVFSAEQRATLAEWRARRLAERRAEQAR